MYYANKKWDIDFAGVLAKDEEVSNGREAIIRNQHDTLQFYLKIISTPPENFPRQVREITAFSTDLTDSCGFYDDVSLTEDERKEALREFLNRYVLFFRVEMRKRDTGEFYVAKQLHIVKKADSFRSDTRLDPIPIFSEDTTERTQNVFEQNLCNQKYIGDNKQISKDMDDTPSMILWRNEVEEYNLYGLFESHDYAHGGFRFNVSAERVRKIELQNEYLFDSYLRGDVLFVDGNHFGELQTLLEDHGEVIEQQEPAEQTKEDTQPRSETQSNQVFDKEAEFMEVFEQKARQAGLYYDKKDLYNFHTAMKTGGLVILSGMSGTGKSKLVQCYGNALGIKKEQSVFIPVRPFWQDDADVIGYLDTLNNLYRPGDSGLINALIEAHNNPENLYIVCFDEMNLARVEHYFSQFLSVLEQEGNKRFLQLYNDDATARVYNQHIFQPTLFIGSNVMFVGTVNIDESTYHFSDKVLDRANVITLNVEPYDRVLEMEEERKREFTLSKNNKENYFVPFEVYSSFRKKERDINLTAHESKLLWELHKKLQKCNRNLGIGWRIIRQISDFLNNLPESSPLTREEAFDIQLVQRVLTKIRGSEEQFKELIGEINSDSKELENSEFIKLLSEMPTEYEFKRTREIINDKARELKLYGHTI
ncbi:McrB family protein [Peribacillus asahii]|uniref:McrB family protein n=1 Tax=Peribacillus asahii TaxID=228899 RepID=UPI00207A099A|nr:AAA family ATPase [Peribacillus asahii]USK71149.1 AAA family ATPase [Peribacillus asahii]